MQDPYTTILRKVFEAQNEYFQAVSLVRRSLRYLASNPVRVERASTPYCP